MEAKNAPDGEDVVLEMFNVGKEDDGKAKVALLRLVKALVRLYSGSIQAL